MSLRSLKPIDITHYKINVGCERSGILPRLFDPGLGDIHERDFPPSFRQPDGMPSGSSGKIERPPTIRIQRLHVLRKREHEEGIWIRSPRCWRFTIFTIPALAFVAFITRSRKDHGPRV